MVEKMPPSSPPQLLELAEHLMVQSDRLVERLKLVDAIVDSLSDTNKRPLALNPAKPDSKSLVPHWITPAAVTGEGCFSVQAQTNLTAEKLFASTSLPAPSSWINTTVELEMAFVTDVLEPVFEAFRAIAVDRGVLFHTEELDELPGVFICPLALQEVVTNLLDNAFRYVVLRARSSPNLKPRVRVRLLPNRPSVAPGITILVEDNGLGIDPADREAVFKRGVRSLATQSFLDGKGIGLDIAQTLTRAMGGTLRIVDNDTYPNCLSGAVFELVLFRE